MRLGIVLVLLLAVPAIAEPLTITKTEGAVARITVGSDDTWITYKAHIVAENETEAYVKITPFSGNPAYLQGDASSGWWTEIAITGPAGTRDAGEGNGTDIVELGTVQATTPYTVAFRIRVPMESLTNVTQHQLAYTIALRSPPEGTGSGGTRDESVDVLPLIRVVPEQVDTEETNQNESNYGPLWPWLLGAVAVVALAIALRVRGVKRAKGPGDAIPDAKTDELEDWAKGLTPEQIEYLKKKR